MKSVERMKDKEKYIQDRIWISKTKTIKSRKRKKERNRSFFNKIGDHAFFEKSCALERGFGDINDKSGTRITGSCLFKKK